MSPRLVATKLLCAAGLIGAREQFGSARHHPRRQFMRETTPACPSMGEGRQEVAQCERFADSFECRAKLHGVTICRWAPRPPGLSIHTPGPVGLTVSSSAAN